MKCVEVFVLWVMYMCTWPGMCLHLLLDMQGCGSFCDGIHLITLCQSVLLCEVLCLSYALFFLCVHALVPGDVISGGRVVSDWSL